MSIALVGALAAVIAVSCAVLARQQTVVRTISHPDSDLLAEAEWPHRLWAWEAGRAACIGAAVTFGGPVGFVPAALVGALAPSIALRVYAESRRQRAGQETVELLQFTLGALRSGMGMPEAIRTAASQLSEIGARPFILALREFDLGAPLDAALRSAALRARDSRVADALDALALGIGEQLPASRCATVIDGVLNRLVFEQRLSADIRARTSGLRTQMVLLAGLVPCLALYLAFTMPGLAQTLGSTLGRFVLVPTAVLFELAGIVASRRVANGVT